MAFTFTRWTVKIYSVSSPLLNISHFVKYFRFDVPEKLITVYKLPVYFPACRKHSPSLISHVKNFTMPRKIIFSLLHSTTSVLNCWIIFLYIYYKSDLLEPSEQENLVRSHMYQLCSKDFIYRPWHSPIFQNLKNMTTMIKSFLQQKI